MQGRLFRLGLIQAVALLVLLAPASASAGQASAVSTPRTADGHPDLTGMWRPVPSGRGGAGVGRIERPESDGSTAVLIPSRRCAPNQKGRPDGGCTIETNFNNDLELTNRSHPNRPLYKPEYWDKVQDLDYDTNFVDPIMQCVPIGIPRVGPPLIITPLPGGLVFLYSANTITVVTHDYRLVSTNGRPRNPDHIPGYWGEAIGRWEGDTLVVETTGFHDVTWLSGGGYFHSFQLRLIERFQREGNTLHYEATVDDPEVLAEPWKMEPRVLRLQTDPNAAFGIPEGPPCEVVDDGIPGRIRT